MKTSVNDSPPSSNFFLVFPRKKITLTRHPFLAPLLFVLPLMFYIRFSLDQFLGTEGAKIHPTSWLILGMYYVLGLTGLMRRRKRSCSP